MKINDWLSKATSKLKEAGIATSRLDALVLLSDVFAVDKSFVLAHLDLSLSLAQQKLLDKQLSQRLRHLPLAYVRGKTEFYGREFLLTPKVLEPRPESETMIDLLKELKPLNKQIIDVGCGSGALGITAALELPSCNSYLLDIDSACIRLSKINVQKHGLRLPVLKSDLLKTDPKLAINRGSIVLANLPYVPDNFKLNEAAMNEPKLAIFGGSDGLDLYRRLFKQLQDYEDRPCYVLTEALPFQHESLSGIATDAGYKLAKTNDFIQLFKT